MKPACRMPCWTGTTGEKLHDSIFNFSFVTVSSGMHLQSSLMMMISSIWDLGSSLEYFRIYIIIVIRCAGSTAIYQ